MSIEQRSFASSRVAHSEDLVATGSELLAAAKNQIRHVVDLAAAEMRFAAMSGMSMLLMLIMAAGALLIAWGLGVAMGLYLLAELGVPWWLAGALLVLLHVLVAYSLWRMTVRLSRNLTLPELRHALLPTERRPLS